MLCWQSARAGWGLMPFMRDSRIERLSSVLRWRRRCRSWDSGWTPRAVLIERSEQRRHDPSDANADVIRLQLAQDAGAIRWLRLDGSSPARLVSERATTLLKAELRDRIDPQVSALSRQVPSTSVGL
jgi:hypothetical protein